MADFISSSLRKLKVVKLCSLILLLLPLSAFSLQRLPVEEGSTITATVSKKALNCISVEGDRIVSVKGITGEFQMDKDPQIGQIYLQPTTTNEDASIEIFITTELGKTYALSLNISDMGAETIILIPSDCNVENAEAESFEKSNPYEVVLVNIIKAMHGDVPLGGYLKKDFNKKMHRVQEAEVLHCTSYLGSQLQGIKMQISNDTDHEINLQECDFYEPGIRAITLLSKRLCIGERTYAYIVKDR